MEMNPHPDSLRSRFATKSATIDQQPQQCASPLPMSLSYGTSQIGTPISSHLCTPRDGGNSVGLKDRVTRRTAQQRSGSCTARNTMFGNILSLIRLFLKIDGITVVFLHDLERQLLEHGITPIYQPEGWGSEFVPNVLDMTDVLDVRSFVSRPAPRGCGPIHCYIRRKFHVDWLYPRYELYLEEGDRFLLCARKRKKSICSNYIISLDPDDISRKTGNFFGKIRSNFLGTEFWFYDKGARHNFGKPICLKQRAELGAVTYEKNVLGLRGPRKLTAIIPAVRPEDDKPFVFQPILPLAPHCMLTKYQSGHDQSKMLVMHNKQPEWSKELNAYCLNFQGRVTQPSVKNFQLVTDANLDYVVLQFGKIGKDLYNLDYRHPMSALQAFAICLTSLDYKIACE